MLLEALDREVTGQSPGPFYYLSRAINVKNESLIDRFVGQGVDLVVCPPRGVLIAWTKIPLSRLPQSGGP